MPESTSTKPARARRTATPTPGDAPAPTAEPSPLEDSTPPAEDRPPSAQESALPIRRFVLECPIDPCEWTHDQTNPTTDEIMTAPVVVAPGADVISVAIGAALERADTADEKAILDHYATHTPVEVLTTIARLNQELRATRAELREGRVAAGHLRAALVDGL